MCPRVRVFTVTSTATLLPWDRGHTLTDTQASHTQVNTHSQTHTHKWTHRYMGLAHTQPLWLSLQSESVGGCVDIWTDSQTLQGHRSCSPQAMQTHMNTSTHAHTLAKFHMSAHKSPHLIGLGRSWLPSFCRASTEHQHETPAQQTGKQNKPCATYDCTAIICDSLPAGRWGFLNTKITARSQSNTRGETSPGDVLP